MKKSKNGLLAILALVSVWFIGLGVAQFIQYSQAQENITEEATPIQEGVMTERQKEHGKLFKGHGVGKKITELLKERKEISLVSGLPLLGGTTEVPPPSLNEFIQDTSCNADSIVIGTVTSKLSQLTSDGGFVFTDYTINVEEILKNNNSKSIQPDSSIIVARPGGKVRLNGHIVLAVDKSAKSLVNGDRYLLFLKNIPTTGDYTTLEGTSAISTSDSKIHKLTDEQTNAFLDNLDAASVIEMIRASVSNSCSSRP
jgi:hypothetical protein